MESFEEQLKNEAKCFKMEPSERVWEVVRVEIRKAPRRNLLWYSAAILLLVSGGVLYFYHMTNPNSSTIAKLDVVEITHTPILEKKSLQPAQRINESNNKEYSEAPKQQQNKFQPPVSVSLKNNDKNIQKVSHTVVHLPLEQVKDSANLITLNTKKVNYIAALLGAETLPKTTNLVSFGSHKKLSYMISIGINVSKPLNTGFNNYVDPGLGFELQLLVGYPINHHWRANIGFGYQNTTYKIGAIDIAPETFYLNTINGSKTETATYRLNNESKRKNSLQNVTVPLEVGYKLAHIKSHGFFTVLAGVQILSRVGAHYIVKNTTNDRLFSKTEALYKINSYTSFGLSYQNKFNSRLDWICAFKIKHANGNTFKKEYPFHERLIVSSLNIGLVF